jgi:hypothetical protein
MKILNELSFLFWRFGDVMGVDRAEEGKTPKDNLSSTVVRVSI